MIKMTIEMIPHGNESEKYDIGTVHIVNNGTGDVTTGNYLVFIADKKLGTKAISVAKFPREKGIYSLLKEILKKEPKFPWVKSKGEKDVRCTG